VADCTIETLKDKSLDEIKLIAYRTAPMERIIEEENKNGNLFGRGINMSERKPIFKATKAELEAARARRNRIPRGTNEEYYKNFLTEKEQGNVFRRRANKWLLD